MKKLFIVLLLTVVSFNLFAENKRNELYRNIDLFNELYLDEVCGVNNEVLYYEIMTKQGSSSRITFLIRSFDKTASLRFLNQLKQCKDKDFKKYILDYVDKNNNISFLWDDYEIDGKRIHEYYCYKLE